MAKNKRPNRSAQLKKQAAKKKRQDRVRKKLLQKKGQDPKISVQKIKKATARMGELVLEPELRALPRDQQLLESLQASGKSLPEQISAFFTPDYVVKVAEAVARMGEREASTNVKLNSRTFLYMFEQGLPPTAGISLLIALYLHFLYQDLKIGAAVTKDSINALVQEYEEEHKDFLNPLIDAYIQDRQEKGLEASGVDDDDELDEAEEEFDGGSTYASGSKSSLMQDFLQQILEKEDASVELEDDLEVFLCDYLPSIGVLEPDGIEAAHFGSFLKGWFVENLNPSKDDQQKMKQHLSLLAKHISQASEVGKTKQSQILQAIEA